MSPYPPIPAARIAELAAKGYTIEDMEAVWGAEYKGQFRWLHADGAFQDSFMSDSTAEAWDEADQDDRQRAYNASA